MSDTQAYVSSQSLIELQSQLLQMSQELGELYEFISNAIRMANDEWQDEQYENFVCSIAPSQNMVNELAEKYKEWATGFLPPRIEKAIEYERARIDIK